MAESTTIRYERGDDGIVVLTLDDPNQSANTMNQAYAESMAATVERLEAEKDEIKGVVITSAKKTFFAGGDLNDLKTVTREQSAEFAAGLREIKSQLRRLETLGVPVVAAINGTALGGGLEIALATHHRVIVDDSKIKLGFPEVKLGLLPGGGGVVRTVRMFGIADALMNLLLQGQEVRPAKALEMGLVGEVVPTRDDLLPAAKAWIEANPEAVQPWDEKGYKIPGGTPSNPKLAQNLPAFPSNLRKQIKGANYPAPHHIMAAAVEGAQVDFDNAIEIEGRYFTDLATGQVAKNMIQAFFFDLQEVNGDRDRPEGIEPFAPKKMVVLGAGMMGAAIAYVSAKAGIEVVLKDVSQEAAEKGKAYSQSLVEKAVSRGRSTEEKGAELLARITPTDDPAAAAGAELVIEAVFEDPAVKAKVFAEIEPHLAEGALLGSNTSTLPITDLAEGVSRPADFIGLHFFSPVDKMPLLEIIKGEQTSEETLYRSLDVAKAIKKVPIVVNDSRGFFTSRVIGTFINEGIAMLTEGIPAPTIEQASSQAGYPAPVLQLSDELNLNLMRKIRSQYEAAMEAEGSAWADHPSTTVIDRMLDEFDRGGRLAGKGFYEYDEEGKRSGLWSGLAEAFPPVDDPASISLVDLEERMLFIESIETIKCLDEGVIESIADANIGSIFGIGFPGWSGGVLQYVDGYEGGPAGFVARARELAEQYGERFEPPASLVEKAERGETYADQPALVASAYEGLTMLTFTLEQEAFVAAIRDFAARECGTREQRDALTDGGKEPHSVKLYEKIAELGWLGVAVPEAYGGSGGGMVDLCLFLDELAYGQIPIGGFSVTAITAGAYERFGSDEQKAEILGGVVKGAVEAIAMSEPDAGSDVGALRCKAVRENGGYTINGQKTWISEAHVADHILLVCRTDDSGSKHDGLSMISIPKGSDGVEIRGIDTMGGRVVNDVFFDDCHVPVENLLGVEGQAWMQLMAGLNVERLIIAAQSLGMARRAMDDTLAYVQERKQFGRPIGSFQTLSHRLADLATELECCRLLTYDVAARVDANPGDLFPREASMAKLKVTETAKKISLEGMQMMGGYGYATEYDMERHVRGTLVSTIYGGTSEIQREIIAKTMGL